MVKLRLKRTGKKNAPCYRLVAADSRSPRDGKNIEILGFYDPINATEQIDVERVDYWIANGAQPSSTAADIIRRAKTGDKTCGKKREIKEKALKAETEAKAKVEAEAKAKAEEEAKAKAAAEAEAKSQSEAAAEAPAEAVATESETPAEESADAKSEG
jgi:small subunit ribosomal protein S16